MSPHASDEDLIHYIFEPETLADAAWIAAHLAVCQSCADVAAELQSAAAALKSGDTWSLAELFAGESVAASSFAETLAAIEEEQRSGEELLRPLLQSSIAFTWAQIALKRKYQTRGVVRALCRAAHEESDPLFALELADAAIAIAELLSLTSPGAAMTHLLGTAWKERANACRILTRYKAALDALDRADRQFAKLADPDYDKAIVSYVRATVLLQLERIDEAAAVVAPLTALFARRGDDVRAAHARLLEGCIASRRGSFAEALRHWTTLREDADMRGDAALVADLDLNRGNALLALGDTRSASVAFGAALTRNRELGRHTEVIRVQWRQAVLVMATGNPVVALPRLREAARAFEARQMLMEAARVEVDVAEALHRTGRDSEVAALCRDLVRRFRAAGLASSALTAFRYLKETATERRLRMHDIDHVRVFLERLTDRPDLRFEPPAAA